MLSLETNPIFQRLPRASRARLIGRSQVREIPRGQRIRSAGDSSEVIFALTQGSARVFHLAETGHEVVVNLFRAPAVFGEGEALLGRPVVDNIEALEDCTVLFMPVADVLVALRDDVDAALHLLTDMASRLAIASANQRSLAFEPMAMRLATYLLHFASTSTAEDGVPSVSLTQEQMAAAIGVTRRPVARQVSAWQREGILLRAGGGYRIRDLAALRARANVDRQNLAHSTLACLPSIA
jgi:CRP-like cAMP-binding protein